MTRRDITWFSDLRESGSERESRETAEAEHARKRGGNAMARMTKAGQPVQSPPDLSGVQEQNDAWQEDLNEAFALIKQAQEREAALANSSSVDESRFPVMNQRGARNA